MNILITGGGGKLGVRLVRPLVQRGDQVVLFDLRPAASSPDVDRASFVEGDLGDERSVRDALSLNRIESIIHLGAVLSADAEQRPTEAWQANMTGTRHVLEAARELGVGKVIFSSTLATYGPNLPRPLTQDAPQWPVSLYGATKVAGERLGVYYHHRFGLDFRGLRFPAIVAPRGARGGASAFVSAVFEQCVDRGRYVFYLEPETRCPVVYIADAVRGLLDLHDASSDRLGHRIYNIAGWSPSARELGALVTARLPEANIAFEPDPMRNAMVNSWPAEIDDRDARRDWGWEVTYDLDRMADEIIETLRDENERRLRAGP